MRDSMRPSQLARCLPQQSQQHFPQQYPHPAAHESRAAQDPRATRPGLHRLAAAPALPSRQAPLPPTLRSTARRALPIPNGNDPADCVQIGDGGEKPAYLPLSATTERVLRILLDGDLSRLRAESVAEMLGISCTTLRRRLRQDHTNYQFLLDRARQYRCETRLRERWLPGKCLADELGYLEVNSFYRAFQRWMGMNYSDYKLRQLREPPVSQRGGEERWSRCDPAR